MSRACMTLNYNVLSVIADRSLDWVEVKLHNIAEIILSSYLIFIIYFTTHWKNNQYYWTFYSEFLNLIAIVCFIADNYHKTSSTICRRSGSSLLSLSLSLIHPFLLYACISFNMYYIFIQHVYTASIGNMLVNFFGRLVVSMLDKSIKIKILDENTSVLSSFLSCHALLNQPLNRQLQKNLTLILSRGYSDKFISLYTCNT